MLLSKIPLLQFTLSYFDLGEAIEHGVRSENNVEEEGAASSSIAQRPSVSRPLSSGSSTLAEEMPRIRRHTCPPQAPAQAQAGSQQSSARSSGGTHTGIFVIILKCRM